MVIGAIIGKNVRYVKEVEWLMTVKTKKLKEKLTEVNGQEPIDFETGLSTGSTLLNLACSGRTAAGFLPGHYYFFVGDSSSGKTIICLTCLAEASINPRFKNYRFIFDNAEDGALMDIRKFFGKAVADRLEPASEKGPSTTVEEFFYHLDNALDKGPCIYVLDSMDALSSDDDIDKFKERKKSHEKGKEVTGTYGTSKARLNSSYIRLILPKLSKTKSILIIISQTRDNIGFGAMFEKKSRSGGHALRFYSTLELWSSVKGKIKKSIKGKDRQLGATLQVKIKKNRLTGKDRVVEIPFYHSYGIDDVGGCCDYLLEESHWSSDGKQKTIGAKEFEFVGSRNALIEKIEEENLEKDLRRIVGDVWREIEIGCEVRRKSRYVTA